MPRSSNQPKRSKKNRQARATLTPRSASSQGESTDAKPSNTANRGQAIPYGSSATASRGQTASGLTISRDQEYGFIREDLKRLLFTAAVLIVVMLALLFLIDR